MSTYSNPGNLPGMSGAAQTILAASTIKGQRVTNRAGEDLGKIEEVMLDPETGDIAYAVLSFGGFLGMGNKLFAIPWHALSPNPGTNETLLDVDKARLENAPGFDKDNWPNMADPSWGSDVHQFYNQQPYWETSQYQNRWERRVYGNHEGDAAARERRNSPDLPEELRRRPIDVTNFPGREPDADLKTSDPSRSYAANDTNRWTRKSSK